MDKQNMARIKANKIHNLNYSQDAKK